MFDTDVVLPQYGGRSFADLPKMVRYALMGQGDSGLSSELIGPVDRRWKKVAVFFSKSFVIFCFILPVFKKSVSQVSKY